MQTLTVEQLMSSPVVTITPQTPLARINALMRERRIRRVPVIDDDHVAGIVTLGDVRNALPCDAATAPLDALCATLNGVLARDIMRQAVMIATPDMTIIDAARLMLTQKIGGLPVLKHGKLVGIITESDLFRALVAERVYATTPLHRLPTDRSHTPRSIV